MPARRGSNLLVFRDGRRAEDARSLCDGLARAAASPARVEDALLRAGEIEGLLADAGAARAIEARAITDRLADIAVGARAPSPHVPADLTGDLPAIVRPSPPESFAYYALSPASFARLARDLEVPSGVGAVIGIRTIGATLSAIVAASLRARGLVADRITVRPTGHPYARSLSLAPRDLAWVEARRAAGASFFVADEGPGMSGSSFLAVAEALARAGVDPRRVTLLGTRLVEPRALLAGGAEARFAALGGLRAAPPSPPQTGAAIDLSAGAWRARAWREEGPWPAVWPAVERVKHLSADGRCVLKFEGLGRWGEAVRARAEEVARAGFGPMPEDAGAGFARYPWIVGAPLTRACVSREIVARIADYCALRASLFPAPDADPAPLAAMARWNASALLGREVELDLAIERPVIADARLHPHEWIAGRDGRALKVDAAAHGDDHGYPGPCDAAWDVAGAVVEWALRGPARAALVERYARASGDRVERRLAGYLAAYTLAQWARAEMAAGACAGTAEGARWLAEARRYGEEMRYHEESEGA